MQEEPFSDMANLDAIGHTVAHSFDFSWSPFWQSYNVPTLPLLRGVQILLFGDSLLAWQLFQTAILFFAAIQLFLVIIRIPKVACLGYVFLALVAINKSSIFWSYKIARESLAEASLYLLIALLIQISIRATSKQCFLLGLTFAGAFLNRANLVLLLPVLVAWTLFLDLKKHRSNYKTAITRISYLQRYCFTICLLGGVLAFWGPWVGRSLMLYGKPVWLSTQSPYSFFWELGEAEIKEPYYQRFSVNQLQKEAPDVFENDYEAYMYSKRLMSYWLRENWQSLPLIIIERMYRSLSSYNISLTKVSRTELFTDLRNQLLIDKSFLTCILGLTGLIIIPLYSKNLIWFPITIFTFWGSALPFLGIPRVIEGAIPIILWGNSAYLLLLSSILNAIYGKLRHKGSQGILYPSQMKMSEK